MIILKVMQQYIQCPCPEFNKITTKRHKQQPTHRLILNFAIYFLRAVISGACELPSKLWKQQFYQPFHYSITAFSNSHLTIFVNFPSATQCISHGIRVFIIRAHFQGFFFFFFFLGISKQLELQKDIPKHIGFLQEKCFVSNIKVQK